MAKITINQTGLDGKISDELASAIQVLAKGNLSVDSAVKAGKLFSASKVNQIAKDTDVVTVALDNGKTVKTPVSTIRAFSTLAATLDYGEKSSKDAEDGLKDLKSF